VAIRASVPLEGGYLVLLDTFDPNWRVEVDGGSGQLLRADGLFRAVRLAGGEHTVRFRYRPTPVYAGVALSLGTLVALAAVALLWRTRRTPRPDPVESAATGASGPS
jgi:hypothetical protein